MDKIIIKNLLLRGILGINPEERIKKQDILINVTLFTDITKAAQSDDADHAVNYKSVKSTIIEHVEESSDFLIEKLISDLAGILLTDFSGVERVILKVEKPGALRFAETVGIEIERARSDFASGKKC